MFLAKTQRRQAKTDTLPLRLCAFARKHAGRRPHSKVFFMVFARREGSTRCDGWTQAWCQRHSDALHHAKRKINSTAPSEELFSLRCFLAKAQRRQPKTDLFLCVFAPLRGNTQEGGRTPKFSSWFLLRSDESGLKCVRRVTEPIPASHE